MNKPFLQKYEKPKKLSQYPVGTSFQAGHLITKNAGWRNDKPVINVEQCSNCLQCYMYCPDGVIYKEESHVAIDYDFCKGCAICTTVCKFGAIHMEKEV